MRAASALGLALVILATSCTSDWTPKVVSYRIYDYSPSAPTQDLHPGELLTITWKATPRVVTGKPGPSPVRLCAALVGLYESVADLKASAPTGRTCPVAVPGTLVASSVAAVDLLYGTPVDQQLALPASLAPGFYELISVVGSDTSTSTTAGIVRVVAAP